MKNLWLILACLVMIVMISLPAMASDGDPYSGDSPQDIWVEGLPSPDPVVSDEPEVSVPPEPEPDPEPDPEPSEDPAPVEPDEVVEVEDPEDGEVESDPEEVPADDPAPDDDPSESYDSGDEDVPVVEYVGYATVRDTEVYSGGSSSLMDAIYAVFGEYTPRTYTVTTYLDDGTAVTSTEIVPGLAGLDYNWLAGVALFAMVLYCIFRMIGGIFRWK